MKTLWGEMLKKSSTPKRKEVIIGILTPIMWDKNGNISEAKARGPHQVLQEEAIRVVNGLPKMEPGKQKGVNVGVKYSLPIAFKVE